MPSSTQIQLAYYKLVTSGGLDHAETVSIQLDKVKKQAGAELGQAQLTLELDFTSIRMLCIELMIAKCYQPIHITEHDQPVQGTTHLFIKLKANLSSNWTELVLNLN